MITTTIMKTFETRPIPPLKYFVKVVLARGDSLRDTGESGDAYNAEAQTEADLESDPASKP